MFKYIFIFLLILIFVPQVRRFLFWLVVGRQMVKEQKRYEQKEKVRKEGEIKVDYIPNSGKSQNPKGGQYVDFEEVKE